MIIVVILSILLTKNIITTQQLNDSSIIRITDINDNTNRTISSMPINNTKTIPTWLNESQTQYNSFLMDDYNYFLTPKGNKVWVATMQLAWNQVSEKFTNNQNISFISENQIVNKMVSNYNKRLFTAKQLNQNSYYVNSGYGKSIIKLIDKQLKDKFPMKQFPELGYTLGDSDFISYAYLFKQFYFKKAFTTSTNFKFNNVTVDAFEAKTSKQKAQIYYKYYKDRDNFLMGIQSASSNDQIWILKTSNTDYSSLKMSKVMQIIKMYERLPNNRIKKRDQFAMPVLDFSYKRTFTEFIGKQFANQQIKGYKVGQMSQRIDFKLTKDGVKLQAEAILMSISNLSITRKLFILDKPFWIILKQTNKRPYLIIEVKNVSQACGII